MTPQQILYSDSPLKTLPLPLLQEIYSAATVVEMANGDTVFTEGAASDGTLYMVVDGELAVLFNRADGSQESKPKGRGELCGEAALVNKAQTRIATVKVVSPSATLLHWNGNALLERPTMPPLEKLLGSIAWTNTRETDDLKRF
jgi:CRP-like cAMP-binding protein